MEKRGDPLKHIESGRVESQLGQYDLGAHFYQV